MKKIKIIISVILVIATIAFLIASAIVKNEAMDVAFKVSATATLSLSVTFSLTINVSQINDSFNQVIYNKNDGNLDKSWQNCYKINGMLKSIATKIEQKSLFGANKEKEINDIIKKVFELSEQCKELLSIYCNSKDMTDFEKERIDFVNEYLESLIAINSCLPISFINTKENNERIDKLLLTAKTLNNKYSLYND